MTLRRIANVNRIDVLFENNACLFYISGAMIDSDGPNGNPDDDPDWQPETSLQYKGKSIDSYAVPGVVVPPQVIKGVKGIVLGCKTVVTNNLTGASVDAVVYDVGPSDKIGEISVECAKRLGIDASPTTGGTSDPNQVVYEIWPNIPATVDGTTYDLQPS